MSSTLRRALSSLVCATALAAGLAIAVAPSATASPGISFDRLSGFKRWDTAADIARSAFPEGSRRAIIANGITFPDALAANYYAGTIDAPILLATDYIVPDAVMDALADLGVEDITLVGGEAVLGPLVENQLLDAGYTIERIAGATRYDTAEQIARAPGSAAVGTLDGARTAILATGLDFADALVAGPIAYAQRFPVVLTQSAFLGSDAESALTALSIEHVLLVGGAGAVGEAAVSELEGLGMTVQRISGSDRFATARALADFAWTTLGFSREHTNLATGLGFPDAIAGGPHGGVELAPILLAGPVVPDATCAALTARSSTMSSGHVFGGAGVVPDSVVTGLAACAGAAPSNQTFSVSPPSNADAFLTEVRTFTVDGLGGVSTLDVALVDCADISIGGPVVGFVGVDGAAVGVGSATSGSITAVNGTDREASDLVSDAAAVDGRITVAVTGDADGCHGIVAFVDSNDDDALAVGDDGRPTEAFGAGGLTTVHEIGGFSLGPDGALRRLGGSHEVTAQVTDGGGDPVPATGIPVLFTVETLSGPGFDSRGCATIDPSVTRTVALTAQTTTNLSGVARLDYLGPADPGGGDDASVLQCLSGVLDLDASGDQSEGDLTASAGAEFDDGASVPTTIDLVAPTATGLIKAQRTFTATLSDQYGDPIENRVMTFEVFRDASTSPLVLTTRVTDGAGRARLTLVGPDTGADDAVVACLENPDDTTQTDVAADNDRCDIVTDDDADDVADSPGAAIVFDWVRASSSPLETAHDSCVLASDAINDTVDAEDAVSGSNHRFRHDAGDSFNLVTVSGPVASVDPILPSRFEALASAGDRIHVDYAPGGASTYTLYDDTNCTQDISSGEASTNGAFG